jgi:hypothetical protein
MTNQLMIFLVALIVGGLEIIAAQAVQAISSSGCEHSANGLSDNNGGGFNPNCHGLNPPFPSCNAAQDDVDGCRIRALTE